MHSNRSTIITCHPTMPKRGLLRGEIPDYVTQAVEHIIQLLPLINQAIFFSWTRSTAQKGPTDLYYDPDQVGSVSASTPTDADSNDYEPYHERVRTVLRPNLLTKKSIS